MKTNTESTLAPSPWTVVRHENEGVESFTIVPEKYAKQWETWGIAGLCHQKHDAEHAALIVRAVNSHAELVALVRNFEAHCSHSLLDLNQGNAGMVSDVKAARALLARLEK